jgi:hypothetical protein
MKITKDAVTGQITTTPLTEEEISKGLEERKKGEREGRDRILVKEVDPMVSNALRWNDLTDAQRAAWTQYRTDLLNVPQQSGFPDNVTWPTKPE